MNIQKTDGTITQTRVADLKQINFLTVDEGGQGLLVKTQEGETVAVLFEANPVVTVSGGKLVVKSSSADAVEFEIAEIAELQFGDASDATAISKPQATTCVLQDGAVLLRGIPMGQQLGEQPDGGAAEGMPQEHQPGFIPPGRDQGAGGKVPAKAFMAAPPAVRQPVVHAPAG